MCKIRTFNLPVKNWNNFPYFPGQNDSFSSFGPMFPLAPPKNLAFPPIQNLYFWIEQKHGYPVEKFFLLLSLRLSISYPFEY